jgi:hypothetical protein
LFGQATELTDGPIVAGELGRPDLVTGGHQCPLDNATGRAPVVSRFGTSLSEGGSNVGVVPGQLQHPVPTSGHRPDRAEAL